MLATAAAAAGGSGWRDGYVLLSTQRAKSTLTAPLLCKADEVSGTMRTVSAETVGAADGTAAGNADTCLRYAHGEDSQAHGAHSPPTHRRMPVSIAAPTPACMLSLTRRSRVGHARPSNVPGLGYSRVLSRTLGYYRGSPSLARGRYVGTPDRSMYWHIRCASATLPPSRGPCGNLYILHGSDTINRTLLVPRARPARLPLALTAEQAGVLTRMPGRSHTHGHTRTRARASRPHPTSRDSSLPVGSAIPRS